MARAIEVLMTEFDDPTTASSVSGAKFDSISDTVRARLQVEVLLDMREYLLELKDLIEECKEELQEIKENTGE